MPDWSRAVRPRLSSLHLSPAREAEIIHELSDHLEDRYQELIASGMSADEATRRALADFQAGNVLAKSMTNLRQANAPESIQPAASAGNPFSNIWQDLRYAARVLMRRPAHTIAVIACLAAGLTVSIGTFSVVTSLLYGDQPGITNRMQVVRMYVGYDTPSGRAPEWNLAVDDFDILRQSLPALGSIAAQGRVFLAAVGNRGPVAISGAFVSGNYFEVLGTPVHAGRLLTLDDERPGAVPVAVVTEHFWRKYLDGKPEAIGSQILLAGRPFNVVGVAPPGFYGISAERELGQDDSGLQVFMPLQHAASWPGVPPRSADWLSGIGRLRGSHTIEEASTQAAVLAGQLASAYPALRANALVTIRPHGITPNSTPLEMLTFVAVLLSLPLTVFAIGCANVMNLQLARAAERARELAVRLSIGASRWQLIRLLTLETMVLAATAVAVSALATQMIFKWFGWFLPIEVSVDWKIAAFSIALVMAVTFSAGLVPAWLVLKSRGAAGLKETAQAGGLGHSRLRSSLVIAQVALSLVMLCTAGVFLRMVRSMELEAPAVLRSQIVAEFDPAQMGTDVTRESWQFANDLLSRALAHPGVSAAAISRTARLQFRSTETAGAFPPFTSFVEITPSWPQLMDLPLLLGRALTAGDDQRVCLVSARFAQEIAPNGSPLGHILQVEDDSSRQRGMEIVGVVADNRAGPMLAGGRPSPVIYVPLPRDFSGPFALRVRARSADSVTGLFGDLQEIVRAVDPRLPWLTMQRGEEAYLSDAPFMRYVALSLAALGLIALSLAATGLYAVMSYVVLLRRREIGVRVAIGAEPRQIVSMVIRQAVSLVLAGGAIGLGLAIPLGFVFRASFVGAVSPLHPVTLLPPFALLLIVGLAAAVLPARRASAIDPINTLREE